MVTQRHRRWHISLLVVCGNNMSILYRFRDIQRRIMACLWNLDWGSLTLRIYLHVAERYRSEAIFFRWVYRHWTLHSELRKKLMMKWCITVVEGHSCSSKSVQLESSYAISCSSSIVTMPVFYRLRDMTIYWSKMYIFAVFTHAR